MSFTSSNISISISISISMFVLQLHRLRLIWYPIIDRHSKIWKLNKRPKSSHVGHAIFQICNLVFTHKWVKIPPKKFDMLRRCDERLWSLSGECFPSFLHSVDSTAESERNENVMRDGRLVYCVTDESGLTINKVGVQRERMTRENSISIFGNIYGQPNIVDDRTSAIWPYTHITSH